MGGHKLGQPGVQGVVAVIGVLAEDLWRAEDCQADGGVVGKGVMTGEGGAHLQRGGQRWGTSSGRSSRASRLGIAGGGGSTSDGTSVMGTRFRNGLPRRVVDASQHPCLPPP